MTTTHPAPASDLDAKIELPHLTTRGFRILQRAAETSGVTSRSSINGMRVGFDTLLDLADRGILRKVATPAGFVFRSVLL